MKKPDPLNKIMPNDGETIIIVNSRDDAPLSPSVGINLSEKKSDKKEAGSNKQKSFKDSPFKQEASRLKASETIAMDEDSIFGKRNVNVASSIKVNSDLKKIKNRNPEEKLAFIRKVFFIVTMQFLLTLIIVLFSFRSEPFRKFQKEKIGVLVASVICIIVIAALLILKQELARTSPNNYVLLVLFTLAKSYFVSYMCAEISPDVVLTAAAMAEGVLIALTIYALIVKNEIAYKGGLMFVTIIMFILFGILMKTTKQDWWTIFLIGFALLFFAMFLIYDMHSVSRGSSRHDFEPKDYVVASLCIYVDIVLIFTYLATIISTLFKSLDSN